MNLRITASCVLLIGLALLSAAAWAQEDAADAADETSPSIEIEVGAEDQEASEDSQFDVELDGRKTWTIRYGFGHPLALATSGLTPGRLSLDQSLTVDVVGEALSVLTIEAHYNDQLPESMQSLALYLDTERLDGVLGDFSFSGLPELTAYSQKMTGLQLEYLIGEAVLTAVVSQTEGVLETAIFVGQTAHADVVFTQTASPGGTDAASYLRNLEGLYAYSLEALYSEDFSSVHFQFSASSSLRSVFSLYEIDDLFDALADDPDFEMKQQEYQVLDADEQVLLLRRAPSIVVRERIRDLIDLYNELNDLSASEKKAYPFTPGTDYELAFLDAVSQSSEIVVDDIVYPLTSAETRRFYALGHTDVRANTARLEISTDGVVFDTLDDFRFPNYVFSIHEADGVLETDFPNAFYQGSSALRVSFDYAVSEGTFMLGLSMIPGTERVTVNSEPLQRDVDYMIDYEIGMLFLLIDLGDTDVLQVDYEVYAGGFGSPAEYASYFTGLTLDLPISETLTLRGNLLRLSNMAGSAADADRARTMPNQHTVAGLQADISLEDFSADVLLGYNHDVFPFDDNARIAGRNEILSIGLGEGYVLFGHRAGLTVNDFGDWETYGQESGLSNPIVHAIAVAAERVFIGTEAGLTVVELDGASPFDRAGNWTRYFTDDGLPDAAVTALAVDDERLWIGTRKGLVSIPAASPESSDDWLVVGSSGELPPITALVVVNKTLNIGTSEGLYAYDIESGTLALVEATEGEIIHELTALGDTVYVASGRGLRGFRDTQGMGWLVVGEPVFSVAAADGTLVYGDGNGLHVVGGETLLAEWEIGALHAGPEGLWIGPEAGDDDQLPVWLLADTLHAFSHTTTGIAVNDPYTFSDAPASDHTATGWMARASFRQQAEGVSFSGIVDYNPPTFRSIGSSRRSDSTGWSLSGTIDLGREGSVRVNHDVRLTGLSGDEPEDRMGNSLFFEWDSDGGPQWTASVRQGSAHEVDGRGEEETSDLAWSFTVREGFFRDDLSLTLAWDRARSSSSRWDEPLETSRVSLRFDWDLFSELSTRGQWARPVKRSGDEMSGSQQFDWSWDWSSSLSFADLDVMYSADWSADLVDDDGLWVHEAEMRLDGDKLSWGGWEISPDLKLEAEHEQADTDLHGEITARTESETFSLRSTLRGHLRNLGRPVTNEEIEWSFNAKYSGFADLDSSLTYTGNRSAAVKSGDRVPSSSDSWVGRFVWSPEDGPRDELSLSVRIKESPASRQVTATAENEFTINLSPSLGEWMKQAVASSVTVPEGFPVADLRVDSKAEYRLRVDTPEMSFSTTGRLVLALAPRWNVSLGAGIEMGRTAAIDFYSGATLELTFAIEF